MVLREAEIGADDLLGLMGGVTVTVAITLY